MSTEAPASAHVNTCAFGPMGRVSRLLSSFNDRNAAGHVSFYRTSPVHAKPPVRSLHDPWSGLQSPVAKLGAASQTENVISWCEHDLAADIEGTSL